MQVGAAACAVVAAAAFPAVVANAETIAPAPMAPAVTQILIDAPFVPLSPMMDIAESPVWLENRIERFQAVLFGVVQTVEGSTFLRAILPPYTDLGRLILNAILGPYGTSSS